MKENHLCSQLSWKNGDFPSIFNRCICEEKKCREKSRIKWDPRRGNFIHIRVDGCIDTEGKKCDCIIFFSSPKIKKCIAFIIEFKSKSYHLSEVREKLQESMNMLKSCLDNIDQIIAYPVIYADSHSSLQKRALLSYRVTWQRPILIKLLNWGDDICKASQHIFPER